MITNEEIHKFKEIVSQEITVSRYEHSLRVADIAKLLSEIHGLDSEKSYLAGILHDITKQKIKSFHIEIFRKNHFTFLEIPEEAYHPFSAYYYLKEKYNVLDEEILSAVRNHTLGGDNLSLMDKILYVSDFLGSEFALRNPDFHTWMEKSKSNLDYGIALKASFTISDLCKKMLPIHHFTFLMYENSVKKINT